MKNNIAYKLILRTAKENEKFPKLKNTVNSIITQNIKYNTGKYKTPRETIQTLVGKHNIFKAYAILIGQDDYINDLSKLITLKIGVDKSIELFENFITNKYGIKVLESFKRHISNDYIKTGTFKNENAIPNQTGIKLLPLNTYLFYAFYWGNTREGHEFWSNINKEWTEECNKIIYNIIENKNE